MDIKVILWATSMVDTNSPNYQYGLNHTYYVRNAFKENLPLHWYVALNPLPVSPAFTFSR